MTAVPVRYWVCDHCGGDTFRLSSVGPICCGCGELQEVTDE